MALLTDGIYRMSKKLEWAVIEECGCFYLGLVVADGVQKASMVMAVVVLSVICHGQTYA